jgi:hypothetical protein
MKNQRLFFGRYVPMAGTKPTSVMCSHMCIGTVGDTFIEFIEKQKWKLCQLSCS